MSLIKLAGKDCRGIVLCFDEENKKLEWKNFFGNAGALAPIPECNGAFFLDTDAGRFDGNKFKTEKTGDSQFLLSAGPFTVKLDYKVDEATGVVSIKPYVKNNDDKNHIIYSCLPRIPIYGNDYEIYGQYTAWCAENQGNWMELSAGNIELTNSAGSSSVSCTPFACIRNKNTGGAVAFNVLPIGDWVIRFRRIAGHRTGYTVIEAGLSDAGLRLGIAAGAELEMPEILMYAFDGDLKNCGETIQRYILPRFPKRHIPDPVFNTWFYNYDVLDAEVLKKQVPVAKKLGIKTFVVDTNIILDILLQREPFLNDSLHALDEAISNDDKCLLSVSAVTDVYYCLRKAVHSEERAHALLKRVSTFAHFTSVYASDIENAMESDITDFEDALVDTVAYRENCDVILSRNTADFSASKVRAITPKDFLAV